MTSATDFLEKITGLPYWEVDGRRLVRREYVDGPKYCEAIRGAREMREHSYTVALNWHPGRGAFSYELDAEGGIPEGWITR